MRRTILALSVCAGVGAAQAASLGACRFDPAAMSFAGDPVVQAKCLLRPVAKFGRVAPEPAQLPGVMSDRIGRPVELDRRKLGTRLSEARIPAELSRLDGPVSRGNDNARNAPPARYFVIHDTSSPWLGDGQFPDDVDTSERINGLARFAGPNAVAHVFVNRRGDVLLGHDFSIPWRATKLETQVLKLPAKGLFLHVEFVQPRRRDPRGGPKNDAIAVSPGFTAPQYQRMALLYTLASVRAGTWLIPAFHAALDEGLSDGHDDPQNFEMDRFGAAMSDLLATLSGN